MVLTVRLSKKVPQKISKIQIVFEQWKVLMLHVRKRNAYQHASHFDTQKTVTYRY